MLRRSYVEGAMARLTAAFARIATLREQKELAPALAEVAAAKRCLPLVPGVLELLSATDVCRSLGDETLVLELAELYALESELYTDQGQPHKALRALQRRASLRQAWGELQRT
jgi:hypothetical protein